MWHDSKCRGTPWLALNSVRSRVSVVRTSNPSFRRWSTHFEQHPHVGLLYTSTTGSADALGDSVERLRVSDSAALSSERPANTAMPTVTTAASPIPPAIQVLLPTRFDDAASGLCRFPLLITVIFLRSKVRPYFAVTVTFLLPISRPPRMTITVTSELPAIVTCPLPRYIPLPTCVRSVFVLISGMFIDDIAGM